MKKGFFFAVFQPLLSAIYPKNRGKYSHILYIEFSRFQLAGNRKGRPFGRPSGV
jgi:hypothetical protein